MISFREQIEIDGRVIQTFCDILPASRPARMLIIGKTPTPDGVARGHYFRGVHGRMFWKRLRDHGLLQVPPGAYEDEVLALHGYGITNIVKEPHPFGVEPSDEAYRRGAAAVLRLIASLQPEVTLFVYKRPLDQILRLIYGRREKAWYGFNPDLDSLFNSRVFVFPMPGTPCRAEEGRQAMSALQAALGPASPTGL